MTELPLCDISVDDRITNTWHLIGLQKYNYMTFQWMTELPLRDFSMGGRITTTLHFSGWQNYHYVTAVTNWRDRLW